MSAANDLVGEGDLALRVVKLEKINRALMGRVERSMDFSGTGFSLFQTAIMLEDKVKGRTRDLEHTLGDLSDAYARLQEARDDAEVAKQNLTAAIEAVSEGFALFDDAERLVLCNSPFRALMPDIGEQLRPGLPFPAIAELFAESRHLILKPRQSKAGWRSQRLELFRKPHAAFIQEIAGDQWIQVSNKKTGAGATVIFQTDITDIVRSERLRREKELDEQSRILQATIDHLPQGICMFAADRRLRAWNGCFIDLLALPVRAAVRHASFERLWEIVKRGSLLPGHPGSRLIDAWMRKPTADGLSDVELARRDGVILNVSASVMPGGGVVASFTDVTQERTAKRALQEAKETLEQRVEERTAELRHEVLERRAIAAELLAARDAAEEADRGKTRFLAAASHDLLQPLNAARIFLSLLQCADLDSRQRRYVEKADSAFGSVEQLLEALLDISRLDSGRVETELAAVPVGKLLETLVAEFQPVAEMRGLRLSFVPTRLFVRTDQKLLRRIVQNLLANALRYTERGGVVLGVRRSGATVSIQIWDTGPGIPADKTRLVFEEFRRLHQDAPNEPKAMGLGLAIVDRIARVLDHGVSLRSVVGRGSCFSVELPAAAATPEPVPASAGHELPHADLRDLTVIVIENDLQILEGMVELLESRGTRAIPTVSGSEALEALDSIGKAPDLIIADYHLDSETGDEAIGLIRRAAGHAVPAVIVTADRSLALQNLVLQKGIALLHKPIRAAELFKVIDGSAKSGAPVVVP